MMTTENNPRSTYFMSSGSEIELSRDQLTGHVPSAYAEKAYSGTSSRYAFFPTDTVVEALRESGWAPVIAQEQRARAEDRFGFQKHLIRFHRREELGRAVLHDSRLELVLMNSHDGGCAFRSTFCYGMVCIFNAQHDAWRTVKINVKAGRNHRPNHP